MKKIASLVVSILFACFCKAQSTADTLVLRDIQWNENSPAGMAELNIPSAGSMLQGFIYRANGPGKHPTLLLLHGYPGNERNLDLAQVVRARGWNVIYFDYRGSWASQGTFSFKHCVEDVVNTVAFCKKYSDSLQIDTSNIALFGHSMGGWICLKALQQLPGVKKGFALSTWDIYTTVSKAGGDYEKLKEWMGDYFVLNATTKQQFEPVIKEPGYFNLANDGKALASKQVVMLDEHRRNQIIADAIKAENKAYFDYEVWNTDHPFTNKRIALIKMVLTFLNR
ncbi:MAG TPA: alpha/beta fold hydrolase [Chitinophagaceae bacterium]|nr:alpha/beta fold hydrolase [Chitinophagaceae bacterium]